MKKARQTKCYGLWRSAWRSMAKPVAELAFFKSVTYPNIVKLMYKILYIKKKWRAVWYVWSSILE